MNIRITKADLLNAGPYACNRSCLLATALTRRGFSRVSIGPICATFSLSDNENRHMFDLSASDNNRLLRAYKCHKAIDWTGRTVFETDGGKPRPDAKLFTVRLTPAV